MQKNTFRNVVKQLHSLVFKGQATNPPPTPL